MPASIQDSFIFNDPARILNFETHTSSLPNLQVSVKLNPQSQQPDQHQKAPHQNSTETQLQQQLQSQNPNLIHLHQNQYHQQQPDQQQLQAQKQQILTHVQLLNEQLQPSTCQVDQQHVLQRPNCHPIQEQILLNHSSLQPAVLHKSQRQPEEQQQQYHIQKQQQLKLQKQQVISHLSPQLQSQFSQQLPLQNQQLHQQENFQLPANQIVDHPKPQLPARALPIQTGHDAASCSLSPPAETQPAHLPPLLLQPSTHELLSGCLPSFHKPPRHLPGLHRASSGRPRQLPCRRRPATPLPSSTRHHL